MNGHVETWVEPLKQILKISYSLDYMHSLLDKPGLHYVVAVYILPGWYVAGLPGLSLFYSF